MRPAPSPASIRMATLVCCVSLLVAGCAPPSSGGSAADQASHTPAPDNPGPDSPGDDNQGDDNQEAEDPAVQDPTPQTPEPDLTSAPTTYPTGDEVPLTEAADFGDGLVIQVNSVQAAQAPPHSSGAEGTDGQIVRAEVMVTNATGAPFAAPDMVLQGYYRENVGAPLVTDPGGTMGTGFDREVADGESLHTVIGFAVPAEDLNDVSVRVDPADGEHAVTVFRGAAGS